MRRRARTLGELGETALIERIARRAGRPAGGRWSLAIGDDAAVLRTRVDEELVFSTDALVEDVHFRLAREGPRRIGRRAMAVNLSDLAAMGAAPVGALLALAAPASFALADFDALVAGFVAEGRRFACPLVGGNLTRANALSLSVTVIGRVANGRALRRTGLAPGDVLYVTGELGRAALARHRADRDGSPLRHVPVARIEAGRRLARLPAVHACIDLSDGLASDLRHLLRGTGLAAEVDPDALPSAPGFSRACRALGIDPLALQVAGGEDYELLFALAPGRLADDPARVSRRLGVRTTRIGRVVAGRGVVGLSVPVPRHHF